ncbi:hypothetical protein [Paracoccus tibetensis]|uniref:DUF2059 domain-containing protein n=1 Tax=Paracoccus tibetensis TaxID=336292 RepID=A0A1G5H343_9RHOB|nr:hypothetical protein [Paracoccus tibetensis]SCY57328.1 hypothetical protein SAMN05660710_01919 [Paracoccus tibetensis]
MLIMLGLAACLGFGAPEARAVDPAGGARLHAASQHATLERRVWDALGLEAMVPILREEAVREAETLEAEGLVAPGGIPWARTVAQIHAPDRLRRAFEESLGQGAALLDPALLDEALGFYETGPGGRLVQLEVSARQAMLEPEVEDAARARFAEADLAQAPRALLIRRLIDEADLLAPNVATGMNASVAFSQGFAEGGGFDMPPTMDELLAEAWGQEAQIEAEAEAWMQAFLMLAYSPLSDAEIEDYLSFASSRAGRALSDLLFAGFDTVFVQTSREMGLAAAMRDDGQSL